MRKGEAYCFPFFIDVKSYEMPRLLKIVLRETPTGRESTPWLDLYREKFARVAREAAEEMRDTKLRGAARVRAFNARVGQKMKEEA